LNGLTMAEWMKENNKDNQALRDREDRLRKFKSGRHE